MEEEIGYTSDWFIEYGVRDHKQSEAIWFIFYRQRLIKLKAWSVCNLFGQCIYCWEFVQRLVW